MLISFVSKLEAGMMRLLLFWLSTQTTSDEWYDLTNDINRFHSILVLILVWIYTYMQVRTSSDVISECCHQFICTGLVLFYPEVTLVVGDVTNAQNFNGSNGNSCHKKCHFTLNMKPGVNVCFQKSVRTFWLS